jgi:hypothetical protein
MEDTDLTWRKASRSAGNGGGCVEVGMNADGRATGVRDSKSPQRGYLTITPSMLGALLASVNRGELDVPSL